MTTTFILSHDEKFIQCPYNVSHQITNARMLRHLKKCREDFLKKLTDKEKEDVMRICRHNRLHHFPQPEMKMHEDMFCTSAHNVLQYLSWHQSEDGQKHYDERQKLDVKLEEDKKRKHSPSPPRYPQDLRRYHDRDRKDRKHRDRDSRHESSSSSSSSNRRHHRQHDYEETEQKYDPHQQQQQEQQAAAAPPVYDIPEEDWEAESFGDNPGYDPDFKLKSETIVYNPQGMTKSERKKFREDFNKRAVERDGKKEVSEEGEIDDDDDSGDDWMDCEVIDYSENKSQNKIPSSSSSSAQSHPTTSSSSNKTSSNSNSTGNSSSSSSRTAPTASSSSSSGTSYYYKRSSYPSQSSSAKNSRTAGSWYDRHGRDYFSDDSDDFEGIDPYGGIRV